MKITHRNVDYLFRDVDYNLNKLVSKSLVSAYLLQEVPRYVIQHLYDVLPRATDIANSEINDDLLNFSNTYPLKHVIVNGREVNEVNGDVTLKAIGHVGYKNVTNKYSIKFTTNKSRIENDATTEVYAKRYHNV